MPEIDGISALQDGKASRTWKIFFRVDCEMDYTFTPAPDEELKVVKQARHWVREYAQEWGIPKSVREDAELLTSELVTNVSRYGNGGNRLGVDFLGSDLLVEISCRTGVFVICVWDAAFHVMPKKRPLTIDAETLEQTGRGMHLIEALAHRHGIYVEDNFRKGVWVGWDLLAIR
ncbi:ATP-binding protein [Kitasatospora sp. NPDC056800]|uniref:ATP-binding protein n=1 Tax=Kitasatospora sp. NPDC056800 TaxID=3345948 RepID=UPI003694E61B